VIKCDFCVSYNPHGKIKCLENTILGRENNCKKAIDKMMEIARLKNNIQIGENKK